MQFLIHIHLQNPLQTDLDEVSGNIEDVDGVGQITQDINEGLGHLPTHIQISVLVLQQLHSMLNGTVRSEILHDLAVDVEEDLDLVLRQVGILILMVEFNRRVQQGLPDLVGVVLLAHLNGVVQNLLDLDVGRQVLVVLVVTTTQDAVDTQGRYLHRFGYGTHTLVEVLHAVVDLILLANLQTVLNGKERVLLKGIDEVVRFVFGHEFHEAQDGSLGQFHLHLGAFVVVDNALQILELEELVVGEGSDQLLLYFWDEVLHEHLGALGLQTHHVLDLLFYAVCQVHLLLLPPLQHQPLERILQELEQQHLGSLLRSHVDLDAVDEVTLQETNLRLQISQVEQPRFLVQDGQFTLDETLVLVIDQSQYLVDVTRRENLSDVLLGKLAVLLLVLGEHLLLETVVDQFAVGIVADQIDDDVEILLGGEPHRLVYDYVAQEDAQLLLDIPLQGLAQIPRDRRQQLLHLLVTLPPLNPVLNGRRSQLDLRVVDNLRILYTEIERQSVETIGGPRLQQPQNNLLSQEMLR
jgi:hypothetical protein